MFAKGHHFLILLFSLALLTHGLVTCTDRGLAEVTVDYGSFGVVRLQLPRVAAPVFGGSISVSTTARHPENGTCGLQLAMRATAQSDSTRVASNIPVTAEPVHSVASHHSIAIPLHQYPPEVRRALLQVYLN